MSASSVDQSPVKNGFQSQIQIWNFSRKAQFSNLFANRSLLNVSALFSKHLIFGLFKFKNYNKIMFWNQNNVICSNINFV